MPAPDYNWVADPDIITAAIKLLAGAVIAVGTALITVGGALIGVLVWIWNKTDTKIDRIATSLESLSLTVAAEVASIKATCKANHKAE